MRFQAQQFLWHFGLPDGKFDHKAWWGSEAKIGHVPVFWEVIRRHPRTGSLLPKDAECKNHLEVFVGTHGLKSWARLTTGERSEWRDSLCDLRPQSGFDPRPLYSITAQSVDVRGGANPTAAMDLSAKLPARYRQAAKQAREDEIRRLATEHHLAGRILIAVSPDASDLRDLARAFIACYTHHRMQARVGTGRVAQWLDVIERFEAAEAVLDLRKQKRDDQLFARYRRIIATVKWPTS